MGRPLARRTSLGFHIPSVWYIRRSRTNTSARALLNTKPTQGDSGRKVVVLRAVEPVRGDRGRVASANGDGHLRFPWRTDGLVAPLDLPCRGATASPIIVGWRNAHSPTNMKIAPPR
jgi:hypothetical protein